MALRSILSRFKSLFRDKHTLELVQLVKGSYKSLYVSRKGTVYIDPQEVSSSREFKEAKERIREIREDSNG